MTAQKYIVLTELSILCLALIAGCTSYRYYKPIEELSEQGDFSIKLYLIPSSWRPTAPSDSGAVGTYHYAFESYDRAAYKSAYDSMFYSFYLLNWPDCLQLNKKESFLATVRLRTLTFQDEFSRNVRATWNGVYFLSYKNPDWLMRSEPYGSLKPNLTLGPISIDNPGKGTVIVTATFEMLGSTCPVEDKKVTVSFPIEIKKKTDIIGNWP